MTIDNAIILSAGKGSRLYPLTEDRPKCLPELSSRTHLEWELDALHASGIAAMIVVFGFHHDRVAARRQERGRVATPFNPSFQVADNLGSVWIVRAEVDRDVLLLSGDTLVPPTLIDRMRAGAAAPVRVTVDRRERRLLGAEQDDPVSIIGDARRRIAEAQDRAVHRRLPYRLPRGRANR